jgi:hypothetical protein
VAPEGVHERRGLRSDSIHRQDLGAKRGPVQVPLGCFRRLSPR